MLALFRSATRFRSALFGCLAAIVIIASSAPLVAQDAGEYSPNVRYTPNGERIVYYEKPDEYSVMDSIGQLGVALILGTLCFVFSYVILMMEVSKRIGEKISPENFDLLCRAAAAALGGGGFLIGLHSFQMFLVYFAVLIAAVILIFLSGMIGKKFVDIKRDVDKQKVEHGHDVIDLKVRYRDERVPDDRENMHDFKERIETQMENPTVPHLGNNRRADISAGDLR